jgi:hypothetical protein
VKVAICLPTRDEVKMNFALSMWSLIAKNRHELFVLNVRSSTVEAARYMLVEEALKRGAEATFFIDGDITFPPDSLERLLSHNVPFVGATCVSRHSPHVLMCEGLNSDAMSGLCKVDRLCLGFGLIRSEVFAGVSRPWFQTAWDESTNRHVGEDYTFCDEVRSADYDVWCDLDLSREIAHEGGQSYTWRPA